MERLASALDLPDLGEAPELRGISAWINSEPLTLRASRGQVILVHFWSDGTRRYAAQGLRVTGIHTPELDIERDPANVRAAVKAEGVIFPVGIRFTHFGEGRYDEQELVIRALLNT